MKMNIICAIVCSCVCTAFIGWRVHALRIHETRQYAIVEDLSLSHPSGCESLLGLAEQTLSAPGSSPESRLNILAIGDASTANEPWQLGEYPIPTIRKAIEGRHSNSKRQQLVLRDISNKCGMARRTRSSPIFLGVKQAVADLRARGCKPTSHCNLFVDSDLEENGEPNIKRTLHNTHYRKSVLPAPIDNDGISVTFCGLAVTADHATDYSGGEIREASARDVRQGDRLQQIWQSLFTKPEEITFEPFCPRQQRSF